MIGIALMLNTFLIPLAFYAGRRAGDGGVMRLGSIGRFYYYFVTLTLTLVLGVIHCGLASRRSASYAELHGGSLGLI